MDDYKNTNAPLGAGEKAQPIKLNTENLNSILNQGTSYVKHLVDSSPIKLDSAFGVVSGERADVIRASHTPRASSRSTTSRQPSAVSLFARGDLVFDKQHSRKGVITKTNVGTSKKGYPVHQVVDSRSGEAWTQIETRLEKRQ